MGDTEAAPEQDDVSFLRTDDMVCLQSTATGSRICLAAEGFGNRHCFLENIADKDVPPHLSSCVFVIEQALSVRALQEMITAEALSESESGTSGSSGSGGGGGSKTLLYGHAVLLRHGHSKMYLACLSTTGSSSDKLAFDVGLQEHSKGEACWWTVHPASKQRSEGEKVRVGDEIILVSVATERYLHTAKEVDRSIVDASFKLTHWSVAPFGTGSSRTKNVGFVFGGDVCRFYHGGDECLTIPSNWSESNNMVIYEGGAVMSQARSLWRLDLIRTKWAGGFINWGYPVRITHITTGRYLGINPDDNSILLIDRNEANVKTTAFCVRADKDDKKIEIDEKEEEVIGSPLIKYGDTPIIIQHIETGFWLSYRSYETKKRGVGRVEEKQVIVSEEGKMDDWLEFSRSQEEEAKTARVIRKCDVVFNHFIWTLEKSLHMKKAGVRGASTRRPANGSSGHSPGGSNLALAQSQQHEPPQALLPVEDQDEMSMCLQDLIAYFSQPEEGIDHEERQNRLKALKNRQDLFQEEGILNLMLDAIDKINIVTSQGLLLILLAQESSSMWDTITSYFYQLLASVIKGNHTNCAEFAQAQRLDWLFSRLSSQAAGEGSGMLDVLGCVLTDSPEALNMMKENHIKVIISLLEKHGRDPKVLDVLCSLCVGNGVAVRSSQNNICDNLLPGRNLLLQTKLVDHVASMRPNIYVGKVTNSAMYQKWYFELTIHHIEQLTHLEPQFRVGWANTAGYVPYPGGGPKWGGTGVGDDLFSYGFDGCYLWTSGRSNKVRSVDEGRAYLNKNDVIGCILDLNVPLITFTVNGMPVRGCFKNFNTDGMFYPVVSFSAKFSCRFLFGGDQGRLKYGPPMGHSPLVETLLPGQILTVEPCFQFGELSKSIILGPSYEMTGDVAFVPHPVDTSNITLPAYIDQIKDKLAENIHEVWATNKIEAGWAFGEIRDDLNFLHPYLTSFDRLPQSEKRYDLNLAIQTLKTIIALGYRITMDKPPGRIKVLRLPNDPYLQPNGYKPAPLDLLQIELNPKMEELIELLAENTHNVWCSERISQGWTYGVSEDPVAKRSPHLVPYTYVDEIIKCTNRDTASETVKSMIAYGYLIDSPTTSDSFDELLGRKKAIKIDYRSYRAEKTYKVTSGKWYFEVEILSDGPIKVGWATIDFSPSGALGADENSYAYDCHAAKKITSGTAETFGKAVSNGDIIGCLLDLHDRTVSYSLNGELLLDASGNEVAFADILESAYVPALTLGTGQKVRLIFGQDINSLKCFTTCGLQEGYQPFCVNMNKNMTFWYSKDEPLFTNIDECNAPIDISRIPAGSDSPPSLKVTHKLFDTQDKVNWEFLRLSLPVTVNGYLIDEAEKNRRMEEVKMRVAKIKLEKSTKEEAESIRHPAKLEEHMLQSGFSMADVQDLQRSYSEMAEDGETPISPSPTAIPGSPWAAKGAIKKSLEKAKSFETATLAVPTMSEAKGMMRSRDPARAKSDEALESEAEARSKSPFKLFGKKEPHPPSRGRAPIVEPPIVSLLAASANQLIPPAVPERPSNLRPPEAGGPAGSRRGSIAVIGVAEGIVDETNEQLHPSVLDLVDEYFYGVRIFPGQDPSHVCCGWVVPNFRHYNTSAAYTASDVRKVTLQVWAEDGHLAEYCDRQNSYMINAGQLYADINEGAAEGGRSNQGMYVGCHIDLSTGILTFTADGKATRYKFQLEPGTKLFPAVFFEATSSEPLQFELGRTPTTLPLSAAILKSISKHLTPQCPPRLKAQSLVAYSWSRVPNVSLKPHALKLSEIRGWSMLVDDPVSMLAVHIPEEDRCLDVLELIEYEKLLVFHAQTLTLYGALCFQSNFRAAHQISFHVDEKQLMYAIRSEYMSGPLRIGFGDLLIALHLESFAYSRSLTQNEFVVPIGDDLKAAYTENEGLFNSITTLEHFSIRPEFKQSDKHEKVDSVAGLYSPVFNVSALKLFVMEALDDAVKKLNRPLRDPIGGTTENLFVPLIKLVDKLLLTGCLDDNELNWLLFLLDPVTFPSASTSPNEPIKGLMEMHLEEGVKLEMCYLMHHLFDLQRRHRVESLIAFSNDYVEQVQSDQLTRYMSVKQEELPAAVAAKRTKEFRCNPIEQMKMVLGFKSLDEESADSCTLSEDLRQPLVDFHDQLMSRAKVVTAEAESSDAASDSGISSASDDSVDKKGWSAKLAGLLTKIRSVEASKLEESKKGSGETAPEDAYYFKVISLIGKWAEESEIENRELVRQMFYLLLRCYNGVGEIIEALEQTYVVSASSKEDVIEMFVHLSVVRSLLPVQMSPEEEDIVRETLWTLAMNRVFFQHPDLIRILRLHENVMDVMTMTLSKRAQGESGASPAASASAEESDAIVTEGAAESSASAIGDTSAMVVACCKFLCYFCRSSRLNQKAMFQHLDFLLENSNILLSRPSLQGSTPLAVAESSVMESPELALALRENYLEKIAVYLSKCGFQSNQDLLDKGYPDIGWDPVEGSQYLGFFKTCVWVNGESVEENANLVIRLLIRRPECLGPALRGEGEGLLQAIKDAISMSDVIDAERDAAVARGEPDPREEDEDYVDMGAAILSFYCTLVDVLGRCAPDPRTIAQGKNDCIRTRAILRSLVPMADLEGVLSLRFALRTAAECKGRSDMPKNFIPIHKQAMVLFLDRVYGIESQETFFRLLENAFLPDLRAATVLERHDGTESEMALAINRYVGNFVLPLLIKYSHFFGNADNWNSLMDATLHTCYRLSKVKILTKGQRDCVSDFLVALTHEMNPGMLLGLLRKLTIDVSVLTEYSTVALRLLTLHYERCNKYYGHSGSIYGNASEEERRLTMLLFSNIFDSLAKMEYDPDLFNKALPCLTAIACALPPDYSLTVGSDDLTKISSSPADGPYQPNPVDVSTISLPPVLNDIVQRFAEHYHDAWAHRKFEHGWVYGRTWAYKKFHPRLMPYHMLTEQEKQLYKEPIADALKSLLALNWKLDQTEASQATAHQRRNQSAGINDYTPQPVDMSSLTLSKELLSMAEKLAENAHETWAYHTINTVGGQLHPQMVPYDLLTDKEKRKNRERSQELLKYLQYEGYHVYKASSKTDESASLTGSGGGSSGSTRFASSLLEKLNAYLDTASISMKLLRPSAVFSRRNSFKATTRDIKFFSKVVLPLVEKLFVAHRTFFLTSASSSSGMPTTGFATAKEKEMVASLFCKLALLLRSKLSAMTHDAKIAVRCAQTLIRATDARTIVRASPDFVKTVWLTYFNYASDDLANCVLNLQQAKFPQIRGTTMKTSSSLNYILLVLIPTLTSLFDHLASNSFGFDLIVDDIQVACYKILNSLYTLGTNSHLHNNRKFIKYELEHHRPQIGNCLGAFAACFPVAFLEPSLNKSNPFCIHAKSQDFSIEAQSVMQELEASMPNIDDLMSQLEKFVESETKYIKEPHIIDILLPMLCAYLPFWWNVINNPPDIGTNLAGATAVSADHLNKMLKTIFLLIKNNVGNAGNNWLINLSAHAGMVVINSCDTLLPEVVMPLAEKLRLAAERIYHKEEITRSFLKSASEESSDLEGSLQEDFAILIRDLYAFYPLLIKYVDLMRSTWIKNNSPEAEQVYHCIASIFNVWSKSSYMRKEEQNFISANEIDNMALIMPFIGKAGRPVVTKSESHGSVGGKVKKKKRDGPRNKDKELASSLMVSALKRLLPVGLNLFAGREQELVQYAKDKFLKKENETDIFDYVRNQLNLPDIIDPSDYMSWQHYLYSKLGKKESTGSASGSEGKELAVPGTSTATSSAIVKPEDKEKLQELLVARIIDMAKVLHGLHVIDHPSQREKGVYRSIVSAARKRAVIACFRMVSLHSLPRHRAMNIFLKIYNELWLGEENTGQEQLVESLTQSFEDAEKSKGAEEEGEAKPDPLTQLVTTLSRKAMTGGGSALEDDKLFMEYAYIFSQSCGGAEEEEGDGGEEGEEPSIHEQELEKQKTLFCQMRLVERGVAEMVLLYIAACKGQQTDMVLKTLKLGISILRGGNTACQQRMIKHLKDKRDVGFFTSIQGLMNGLTVLDLDAFERNQKAEGLGVGAEGTAGEKNMHDEEFSCALFRFIQLLCEGHNLDFQNYLRTQTGNTTTVNVIIITVDYLLRLQESMMDFYWHYSSKSVIDPSGKENYCKAINVAKQVFSTLTESIQGPCQGNQQALAHSRLWDAVGGFLFLFAHMQDKLSKNSSQLDLLIELLDLQKEMVVMLLSMLEGNVVNGTIGRQMVDTLVESAANLELILKFFDLFLKLPDVVASNAFKEIDKKSIGWVSAKDFKKAIEQQKVYSAEEIEYLMSCIEPTHDGLVDYREFAERFSEPAKEIGFNLAVLLTNLSEHMPSDPRLQRFLEAASSILEYFEHLLGRIEIMGSAKRVERVYFEIKESSIAQWEKPQIKESKRAFFYFIVTEGGDKEKLEYFVDFCEDAIFEMQHAANIAMEEEEEAPKSCEYPFIGEEEKPPSIFDPVVDVFRFLMAKLKRFLSHFTPSNIKAQIKAMKEMTPAELAIAFIKLIGNTFVFSASTVYSATRALCKFILRLMTGEPIGGITEEEEEEVCKELALVNPFHHPESPAPLPAPLAALEVIAAAPPEQSPEEQAKEAQAKSAAEAAAGPAPPPGEGAPDASATESPATESGPSIEATPTEPTASAVTSEGQAAVAAPPAVQAPTPVESAKPSPVEEASKEPPPPPPVIEEEPEVKGEESKGLLSKINFGDYVHRFVCFLARNFYNLKYIALFVAFMINFILLFYRVSVIESGGEDGDENGSGEDIDDSSGSGFGSGSGFADILGSGDDSGEDDSGEDSDEPIEWIHIEDKFFYLNPLLRALAMIHAFLAFCMLVGYYHLKLPLCIFKREKEIARKMEFEGLYITEQPADDDIRGHWDKLVISTPSFPLNYWDKFAKKKVRDKYAEQYGYEQISTLLGMDKSGGKVNWIDFKYQVWKVGVTITDNSFLYNLWYFSFSILGNFNYFFFCAHLLDIAVAIASLRTILQSVTHNGKQLVLTVMLLTIIVYIYTVIAFNFFRKFYVSGDDGGDGDGDGDGDDDGGEESEPDRKCHNMLTCFVFNVYQGVRAGGGIGDVIEPPDGDEYEIYRIIFDITFFFFIIVILLAIIQGLIIDAFGELRSQLQSVVDDMEAACFICGIGKDYFDKVPHGFETHVQKEHNLANYLFFLMHLINKPDTDYTGQETYVWEMYQQRCWDFFPVGECFQKQYEAELA